VEGDAWTYAPVVRDPGADAIELALEGPAGAALVDGEVRWTPTFDDALAETADFRLTARDDDGGEAVQRWTLRVALRDLDDDGLPDTCEARHDPATDSDGDGRSDLAECVRGSPVGADGRPSAPVPVRPLDGAHVGYAPELEVEAASDPDGDALAYAFQVRDGEDVVAESGPQAELVWVPDPPLPDGVFTWRARATDGAGDSPWSDEEEIVVGDGDPVVDAAVPDAAVPDADVPADAAAIDAAPVVDAAAPDALPADAATPDASLPDATPPDGALPDGALPDAMPPDGALPDGAIPDAAPPTDGAPLADLGADAGDGGGAASGCECDSTGGAPALLPALLLVLGMRRRRRPRR
jgi:uncharacterized protein (TIGR03382 family)